MKKQTIISVIVLILLIIGAWWYSTSRNEPNQTNTNNETVQIPVTETTKVSNKVSSYKNSELGFSVSYPTEWEADQTDTGVMFIMPIDQSQVSTVVKLQADVVATGAKCAFPPVTTVKDRSTLKVGDNTFNMISMSNSVQGRNYFNRMYSLQKGSTCYMFSFSTITLSPESKKLTGSNKTQAENNNKALISAADTAFTEMVKSFALVVGSQGIDETKAPK